ncbi:hypothetical protein F2Q70_00044197 [Brassica cretica]|uniref:Uncharacterized protein n=1 Tax=Brassica cretica TaxID=69181 RepID=A0A8S9KDL7_BRACR|nr:hypothetical protein F2Q70_00044197 [Brassica cretica]
MIGFYHPDVVTVRHSTEAIKRNPKDPRDAEKCIKIDPTFSKGYSRKIAVQFFIKEYENSMDTYQ